MIDWILEILKESGAVGNNNETIVKYGLQKAGSFLLDLIITFICAAFFGIPIEGVVFWIVLFVQRMYIGGYHAKTQLRCLFISWIVTIISFSIIKMDMSDRVLLYMMGVVTIIIWLAAPVEAENKPLSERERVLYRKIGKWMMGICFMVAVIAKSIHLYVIFKPLALATIGTGLRVIIALVLKYQKACNCRK